MHQLADWLRTETANLPNMRYIEATRSGEPKRKKVNISHNQGGPRAGSAGWGPGTGTCASFNPHGDQPGLARTGQAPAPEPPFSNCR